MRIQLFFYIILSYYLSSEFSFFHLFVIFHIISFDHKSFISIHLFLFIYFCLLFLFIYFCSSISVHLFLFMYFYSSTFIHICQFMYFNLSISIHLFLSFNICCNHQLLTIFYAIISYEVSLKISH